MRNLRAAIIFLTRVPIPFSGQPNAAAAVPWYPVAGALIGVFVGGTAAGLLHLVPPLVAAALAIMLGVLVTGAFHEDGLADVADAFAGGWTPADRMRILKDPLHGSYGVAAMCGSITIRVACVASFGGSSAVAFSSLIAAHALGRCAAIGLLAIAPTASTEGLGVSSAQALNRPRVALGIVAGIAFAAIATGWWVAPFIVAMAAGSAAVGWLAMRKIGGVTGDVLGAAEQVVECLVLVVATGLAARYTLWWT